MNRNEKLAIEVGKLRGDIRSLRKKNSALLIWKLKVDQSNFVEKTQTHDIGTQTEDVHSLIHFSDPYQTPLRVRPISKQNSALQEGSMASAEPRIYEPSDEVYDFGEHILHEENVSGSSFDTYFPLDTEEDRDKRKSSNKQKARRSSSLQFSYQSIVKSASPKQGEITEDLAEKIRDESIIDLLTSSSASQRSSATKQRPPVNLQSENRRRSYIETPDRPTRSVKKPVTYKEPSLRVKVRKGFQFFKFTDSPSNVESPNDSQHVRRDEQLIAATTFRDENQFSRGATSGNEERV